MMESFYHGFKIISAAGRLLPKPPNANGSPQQAETAAYA
jgi:hypothetical protein